MEGLKQLGKYQIAEIIGASPLTTVYKATGSEPDRVVALKLLRKQGVDRSLAAWMVARFKNQVLAAERLAHPGIADVYDHGEDEQIAYLAMEYLAGRGLRDFLTLHLRLSLTDVMSIMSQLLAALDFAHANGVVHRDVKPANIIMLLNGRVKLADFGLALIDTFDLAATGAASGTPAYMSPEQHSRLEADRRSDVFSSGVVLYELLTGRKPFEGTPESVGDRICNEAHRPASELNPQGSPAVFDAVIARALAKDPDKRFPTAREFAGALESAFKNTGEAPRQAGSDPTVPVIQPGDVPDILLPTQRPAAADARSLEALFTREVGP